VAIAVGVGAVIGGVRPGVAPADAPGGSWHRRRARRWRWKGIRAVRAGDDWYLARGQQDEHPRGGPTFIGNRAGHVYAEPRAVSALAGDDHLVTGVGDRHDRSLVRAAEETQREAAFRRRRSRVNRNDTTRDQRAHRENAAQAASGLQYQVTRAATQRWQEAAHRAQLRASVHRLTATCPPGSHRWKGMWTSWWTSPLPGAVIGS
jgi:hypothetical protein